MDVKHIQILQKPNLHFDWLGLQYWKTLQTGCYETVVDLWLDIDCTVLHDQTTSSVNTQAFADYKPSQITLPE